MEAQYYHFFTNEFDFQVEKSAKQLEKAAKMEKFKEKLQKKPTEAETAKETKPKESKAKSAKPESATKDVNIGNLRSKIYFYFLDLLQL